LPALCFVWQAAMTHKQNSSALLNSIPVCNYRRSRSEPVVATRYSLDGPRIESRWRRNFPHLSRLTLGSTHPPVQWIQGPFCGDKAAGAWGWPPFFHRRGRVGVVLYLCLLSVLAWRVTGEPANLFMLYGSSAIPGVSNTWPTAASFYAVLKLILFYRTWTTRCWIITNSMRAESFLRKKN
jgi:hypothetical protein